MNYKKDRVRGTFASDRDGNNNRTNIVKKEPYLSIQDQLDQLWHDIDDGKLDKTGSWYLGVKAVKERFPKS